jgi:hypothetical protein
MSAGAALLFVAKRADCYIHNFLFQCDVFVPHYILGKYELRVTQYTPNDDVCIYLLGRDYFYITLIGFGIDTELTYCDPYSNVDFRYFVWEHCEMFSFKKVAMPYVPYHDGAPSSPSRLVYLLHHRAGSEGWRIRTQCGMCRDTCKEDHRPFTSCVSGTLHLLHVR